MSSKAREALNQIHELLSIGGKPDTAMCIRYEAANQIAKAALAEPRRNCDVGTAAEQIARFAVECLAIRKRNTVEPCAGCPCSRGGEGTEDCQLYWAQMPYEEGTNDEQK